MENKTFQIGFNLLRGTLAEQMTEQGYKFDADEMDELNDCKDAIWHLSINSMINDKLEARLKDKLFRKVRSHIMKKNKMKLAKPSVGGV